MSLRHIVAQVCLAGLLAAVVATTAPATTPGDNGPIVFAADGVGGADDIYLVNPDGTGLVNLTNHPAVDYQPAIAPHGLTVAFVSDRDGNGEIYTVGVDGSGLRRLTNDPAFDHDPAWSPDHQQIAFTSDRAGGFADIWVMDADLGTFPTNLTATPGVVEIEPDYSPDGTRLAISYGQPGHLEIGVMPSGGGPVTSIYGATTFATAPSWSPDGSRIAFETAPLGTTTDVYVVGADGSNPRNLTNHPAVDGHPAWSPDGTLIAFHTDRSSSGNPDIATMAPDGSGVSFVVSDVIAEVTPSWAPAALDLVMRIYGSDRIETAVAISQESGPPGGFYVPAVLARSDAFPDALAGAALAYDKLATLLLTPSDSLHPSTAAELQRVVGSSGTVYLLGGTAALSAQLESEVQALGYTTVRLAGPNRFATAVAVAQEIGTPSPLYLADGGTFQAAEVSAVAAAVNGGAVLLTSGSTMPAETAAYLANHSAVPRFAVGNDAIAADPGATPVGGADPYEVSVNLANTAFAPNPGWVSMASGTVYADGLTGGPHSAIFDAPLLLTDPNGLPPVVEQYLRTHAGTIIGLFVYGGPAAISDPVVDTAQRASSGLP